MKCAGFDEWQTLLTAYDRGTLSVAGLCQGWRAQTELLQSLPPRYGAVLEDILGRMESSALFSEESCSFSMADLRHSLQVWLDKARAAHGSAAP